MENKLKNGINVLVDKPLAISVKACRNIIATAEKYQKTIMVGFNLRQSSVLTRLKKIIDTGTWLNDNSRWLKLFPEEWHNNLSPRTNGVSWHLGYWGQLITARGTFNHKAGNYLRKNGALRYKLRNSHCSFHAMRKHLNYKGVQR